MVNFFWVDARSRMAYQYFGDVVTFDTTYKTNKYDMPFASFTGLNHHCQSILLGCALLQDETKQTFVWLFETWLQAMWGKEPIWGLANYFLLMYILHSSKKANSSSLQAEMTPMILQDSCYKCIQSRGEAYC